MNRERRRGRREREEGVRGKEKKSWGKGGKKKKWGKREEEGSGRKKKKKPDFFHLNRKSIESKSQIVEEKCHQDCFAASI